MSLDIRPMQPGDMPAIVQLHQAQNEALGTDFQLPRIFGPDGRLDRNIALALTVERDAVPVQGIYFATGTVEMCFAGRDPKATAFSRRQVAQVRWALKAMGHEAIRCLVPQSMAGCVENTMGRAGFKRKDFAVFYQEI